MLIPSVRNSLPPSSWLEVCAGLIISHLPFLNRFGYFPLSFQFEEREEIHTYSLCRTDGKTFISDPGTIAADKDGAVPD